MPLDDPSVVDLVSLSPAGDRVIVHIIATEPWDEEQVLALQAKLKNTAAFTVDGQLEGNYPEVTGLKKTITIRADFSLNELAERFVQVAREQWCEPEGVELSVVSSGSRAV